MSLFFLSLEGTALHFMGNLTAILIHKVTGFILHVSFLFFSFDLVLLYKGVQHLYYLQKQFAKFGSFAHSNCDSLHSYCNSKAFSFKEAKHVLCVLSLLVRHLVVLRFLFLQIGSDIDI